MWWEKTLLTRSIHFHYVYRDCPHPIHRLACLHGDAILQFNGARSLCRDCYKTFKELPDICTIASLGMGYIVLHSDSERPL